MKIKILSLLLALTFVCLAGCTPVENPTETTTPSSTVAEPVVLDMQALYSQMTSTLPDMLILDDGMMLNYCGIKAEDCVQAVVAICSNSLQTDEVWLIEAKDAQAMARLKTLVENRLKYKGDESVTYSPEQYAVVQKAKVIENGNYLLMLVCHNVDALESVYKTAAGLN